MPTAESSSSLAPAAAPGRGRHWLTFATRNLPVPLVLLALFLLGHVVENPDRLDPYYARILMLIGINVTLAVSLQLINGISGQFSLGHAGFMAVGAYLAGYPSAAYSDELTNPAGVLLFYAALAVAASVIVLVLWLLVALLRLSRRLHNAVALPLLFVIVVWFVWDISAAHRRETVPAYLAWSHLITFVQSAFAWTIVHGTPVAAWLHAHLPATGAKPLTFLILLLGGATCAAAAGLLVGLPTLRLRGDYLAIATLGFSEIIRVVITNSAPLGRATGLSVPPYAYFPYPEELAEGVRAYHIFPWVFGAAFVTTLVIWRLQHSAKGRAIAAVRENEIAAAAVGVDPTHHKVISFVIGAFFAGLAGALFAHYDGYLNPNAFGFLRSIEVVVMVTIGGLGSVWGAIAAAAVLTFLPEFLRDPASWFALATRNSVTLPERVTTFLTWVGENRMVFYALLLILIMLARAGAFPVPRVRWRRTEKAPAAGATT